MTGLTLRIPGIRRPDTFTNTAVIEHGPSRWNYEKKFVCFDCGVVWPRRACGHRDGGILDSDLQGDWCCLGPTSRGVRREPSHHVSARRSDGSRRRAFYDTQVYELRHF